MTATPTETAKRQPVSAEQMQYLEYLIWHSEDADEFTRKCLILLARNSEGLSKRVRLILNDDVSTDVREKVVQGFHDMGSGGGTTRINELFHLAGSDLFLDYGGIALISHEDIRVDTAESVSATLEEINSIVACDPYQR